MRRITVATISVAASLALAACAERDTTSPRSIASGDPSFTRGGSTCNFSTVKNAAQAYFTSNQDPVFDMIKTMQSAFTTANGGNIAATPEGWVILSRVADKRLTDSTGTGGAGAAFVVAVTGCMADLAANSTPLTLPTALTDNSNTNLARVLNSGIFEIRVGGQAAGPVAGKNISGRVKGLGSPVWGVEAVSGTWPGSITYAVIGYPIVDSNALLKDPPLIDTNDDLGASSTSAYQRAGTWPFNAFELTPLPATALSTTDHANLLVAICLQSNPIIGDGTVSFLVHNDAEVVANARPTVLCGTGFTGSIGTALPWYTRLARGAAGFFKPGILFAQEDSRDFIGGLPSGWSPISGGNIDPTMVTLSITRQPVNNTRDSMPDSLIVLATVKGTSTPVPHFKIDGLSVLNNQGSPAGAVIVEGSTNLPLFTDGVTGKATVKFAIGKPGAYYIVVSSSLDGVAGSSVTTVKFNVKN